MIKRIAIIEGGFSREKEISLLSAETVYESLSLLGYQCVKVRIDEDGWRAFYQGHWLTIDRSNFSFKFESRKIAFDFAYVMIHGAPAEDGHLSAYFELIGLPHSTCGTLAAALTFNKFYCNQFLKSQGISVAPSYLLQNGDKPYPLEEIVQQCGLPCFVKPAEAGSSFGISKVVDVQQLPQAIENAFAEGGKIIIETAIEGRELSQGVFINKQQEVESLPVTEIIPEHEFFDYAAKYQGKSEEITPAKIDAHLQQNIDALSRKIYTLLDLRGICRIDYIASANALYCLEVNTIPGMSRHSIVPQMVAASGGSLSEVLQAAIVAVQV